MVLELRRRYHVSQSLLARTGFLESWCGVCLSAVSFRLAARSPSSSRSSLSGITINPGQLAVRRRYYSPLGRPPVGVHRLGLFSIVPGLWGEGIKPAKG